MDLKDSELSEDARKFSEELEELFKEYGVTNAVFAFAIPEFNFTDEAMFKTAKMQERTYEFGSAVYVADQDLEEPEAKNNKAKDLHTAMHILSTNLIQQLIQIDQHSKFMSDQLDSDLGINTARMYALQEGEEYVVFTEKGILRITHLEEAWQITVSEGDEPATNEGFYYRFIGNVQEDGTIFHSKDLPILSTGDRALFGKFMSDEPNPVYMTSIIKNVIPLKSLN